jgi:hypothetical protein
MKMIWILIASIAVLSCKDTPVQPPPPAMSHIVSYVYWADQGVAGKQIDLVPTSSTKVTDSKGIAEFTVPAGRYTLRAYGIGTPGPGRPFVDFNVETTPGLTTTINIFDCQDCDVTTP